MTSELFSQFAPLLRSMSQWELDREVQQPDRLRLESASVGGKRLEVVYAPFDSINPRARIVLVGLTPGRQQMGNALREARRLLSTGASLEVAAQRAKIFASFSGSMRTNLVDLLDYIGVARLLSLSTTASLWNGNSEIVHFTSALRYPVFVDGANYSGSPDILKTPLLGTQLGRWFATEMKMLSNALFVPLGPRVGTALEIVARKIGVSSDHVLSGLPHPSGANAERIAYFLERKSKSTLSAKTNSASLEAARAKLLCQIERLRG